MTNAQVKINPSYLKAAMICASTEGTRYYLNGVHFIITKDWVRLVATDGHRAFYYKEKIPVITRSAFPDDSLEVIVDLKDLKKALVFKSEFSVFLLNSLAKIFKSTSESELVFKCLLSCFNNSFFN